MSLCRKPRGSYTTHACAQCRSRKRKCDGVEPMCGFCEKRGDECVWGSQPVKKPASKQLVESLRNRIEALEKENDRLRADLSQCTCFGRQYLESADGTLADTNEDPYDESLSRSNSSDDIEELCAPTRHLVLECDELRLYGPTSAFRMNPNPERRTVSRFQAQDELKSGIYTLHADDNIDWSRHLPVTVLTRSEHDRLLDIMFKFTLGWGMRLLPELFFRDMYRSLSSPISVETEHYSPMLHNSLVAMACSFSDDPAIRDIDTKRAFLTQAKSFMDGECQEPKLSTIQGLDIIGSCHSTMAEQTLGYMYFGMSGRTSQALGLNADCSSWVTSGLISHQAMVQRSWAYWALFATDVCWSLYVGRDCCLPDPSSATEKVSLPPIDEEIDSAVWDWSVSPTKVPEQPNRMMSTFVASCELMRIGRKIIDVVNSGVRQKDTYKFVTEIDLELNAWKDNLSPDVDITPASRGTALPHRLVLHMTYWWLFSLLHRPFYYRPLRSNSELDHIKICDRAANNMMSLLSTYDNLYGVRFGPTVLMQVTFSAGTVFLLSAVRALSGTRVSEKLLSDSMTQADTCVKYLSKIALSYESSEVIKGILENMTRAWVVPRIGVRFKEVGTPSQTKVESRGDEETLSSSSGNTVISEIMESWEHQILTESQEFLAYQQPMDTTYACVSSGTYMPGGEMLPNQPFMTFTCSTSPEPMQDYPDFNPGDFSIDPDALVPDTGMSAQELMDDLARYWR